MSEVVCRHESADRAWVSGSRTLRRGTRRACWPSPASTTPGAKTGYVLEFSGPVAAIVWLPGRRSASPSSTSAGSRYWPGVLIGDLLANDYSVLPLGSALGQTCGNMLEVVIAVLLLRRLVRHGSPLASVRAASARSPSRSRPARPSARRSARPRCSPAG